MMFTANMVGWRQTAQTPLVIGKKQRGITSLLTYLWDRIVNFLFVAHCLFASFIDQVWATWHCTSVQSFPFRRSEV